MNILVKTAIAKQAKIFPNVHFTQRTRRLGAGIAAAVGFVIVAKAADAIIAWLQERHIQAKSSEYFAKMLEAHPALKKEKPETVARYWASLYHFAPHMAQDPLAAGSFIRQSIARGLPEEFGGPAPDTYLALTDINRKIQQSKVPSDLSVASTDVTKGIGTSLIRNIIEHGFF